MLLYEALELGSREVISFCGGGGKTSTIQRLCAELLSRNQTLISTVTTRIGSNQTDGTEPILVGTSKTIDNQRIDDIREQIALAGRALVAADRDASKLSGLHPDAVCSLHSLVDFILIEADGSRGLSLKAPAEHEPVVPSCTSVYVAVMGIDAVGRQIQPDTVHRLEQVCRLTSKSIGNIIDAHDIAKLAVHPQGIFKGAPATARQVLLLNKVTTEDDIATGHAIISAVRDVNCHPTIIMANTRAAVPVIYRSKWIS